MLIAPSAALASPSPTLSLDAQGNLSPLVLPCSSSSADCRATLWAKSGLIENRLGVRRRTALSRIAQGESSLGSLALNLNSLGRNLLRAQPDGVLFRLQVRDLSTQAVSWRKVRLRFPRALEVPVAGLFKPGSLSVSSDNLAPLTESLPDSDQLPRATCVGHTAPRESKEEALEVAYRRALEVCKELPVERFRVLSRGDREPRATNQTPEGRALNRRVEVRLSFAPAPALSRPLLGVHSMLKPGMSRDEVEQTMLAARNAGLPMVRFDLALNYVGQYTHVYPGMYDFAFLDTVRDSASRNGIKLLAVATWAPQSITDCPDADGYRCPPRQLSDWTELLAAAASHAPEIKHWEIWNEPNTSYWRGSVEQYAALLNRSVDVLHNLSSDNRVVMGAPAGLDRTWLSELLPLITSRPDIVSLHLRPRSDRVEANLVEARSIFASAGFEEAPLWITEFGYPSDPASQFDPTFASGPESQADYYVKALALMKKAGADRVFLTGRDAPEYPDGSPFRSEGLWSGLESFTFKPAYRLLSDNS